MSGDAHERSENADHRDTVTVERSPVVDVAYARLEVGGRPGVRVGTLIESIDSDHVQLHGAPRGIGDAWAQAFGDVVGPHLPQSLTIAHPTTWGSRRAGIVIDGARTVVARAAAATTVHAAPRAVLVAATHLEPSARVCVVAETHDGRLDVHRITRDDDGWHVARTDVLDDPSDPAVVGELVDDTVEAILVDGDNRDRLAAAIRLFEDATPTGRVAAVERALIHRFGGEVLPSSPPPRPPDTTAARGPSRRALVVGAVAVGVVIAAVVAGTVAFGGSDDTPSVTAAPATSVRADVGRVSMVVPVDWRRTSDAVDDTGAIPFTTFAARTDDRRIIVVQNAVRIDSTPTTVATSLRNRLRQSGGDTVSEFSAVTRYADRDVISYRETPGSGAAIRWYVMVSAALQVSVGCQPGTRGESVDDACAAAVGSVTIAPLR
ncbi:type VII secretion-associated protein [Williamsia herbipolensis]|uniref:Type VII secretion-associated protein n=1 Tax=Williamsia herbipolensis TaxID=1603258 RepID=A0AAU4K290_9NOCA|nr:type VII secretion-associated protein [Williamsia herbipolensis]